MRVLPFALSALVLLSGCLGSSSVSDTTSGGHHLEKDCKDGDCTFCRDGQCVPCSEAECNACMDAGGDCAAVERAVAPAPQDFDAQETRDLANGLPDTTWEFDAAPGASGHVHLVLSDPAAHASTVMASACLRYSIVGPHGTDAGDESTGNCGGTLDVGGVTATQAHPLAWWDELQAGHYTLTVSAPRQANQLTVDIHVDNP